MRLHVLQYVALTALLLSPAPAIAQPVPSRDPDTTSLYPAGGRRGETIRLRVGTECFPPGARLTFYGQGILASEFLEHEIAPGPTNSIDEPSPRRKPEQIPISYPREWEAEVTIAADADLGPHFWRATCAQGGSRARVFVVGDLPEVLEAESNSLPERAQLVKLPVTLNGRIAGERDLDYYVFAATQGQVIHCEVMAGRLGSPLDPVVTVYDEQGRRVAGQETRIGVDPVFTFRAPLDGDYRLLISNVSLHGGPNYVYRVTLSARSRPLLAFPAGGRFGAKTDFELLSADGAGGWRSQHARIELPASAGQSTFWRRGVDDGVIGLEVGDLPEIIEADDNLSAETAQAVDSPVTINGRFSSPSDEDWFRISAKKGQRLAFRAAPAPEASRATPVLVVWNSQHKRLQQVSAYQTAGRACRLDWQCPADGEYLIQLQDARHGFRGGPDFIYRLTIADDLPDFALRWPEDRVNVTPGAKTAVTLQVERRGGFDRPITLECRNLPDGVTVQPSEVPAGKSTLKLTFAADENARPGDVALQVEGVAKINADTMRRTAHAPHAAHDATGAYLGAGELDALFLTVRHKPVFRLYCAEAYLYAHRGMVFPYRMQVERLDGYGGEIVLQSGDRQNRDLDGVDLQRHVTPGGAETSMPIYLPESMHANVQSQSQLYVQAYTRFVDRWGDKQSLLVVSEKRCMLRTLPTVVKLKAPAAPLSASPGDTVRLPLTLKRTTNFPGPMQVELIEPPAGVVLAPAAFDAGQSEIQVAVTIPAAVHSGERLRLQFRASGDYPGHLDLISEAEVEVAVRVKFASPPADRELERSRTARALTEFRNQAQDNDRPQQPQPPRVTLALVAVVVIVRFVFVRRTACLYVCVLLLAVGVCGLRRRIVRRNGPG